MITAYDENGNVLPIDSELVTEVTVSQSRKVNLGNYESVDHFISIKLNRFGGHDVEKVIEVGNEICEKEIAKLVQAFVQANEHVEKERLPTVKSYGNKPSNSEPATPEQKMLMINWISANLPFEEQEEAKKKANGMTKAQAIEKIKTLKMP